MTSDSTPSVSDLERAVERVRASAGAGVDEYLRGLMEVESIVRELKKPGVAVLRAMGWSWRDIGGLIGTSPQGALDKYRDIAAAPSPNGAPPTGSVPGKIIPSNMRRTALARIEEVTGGSAERVGGREQSYLTKNGRTIHLRTRAPDYRPANQKAYWFGIQERFWQAGHFFVLVCGLDFCLVIPVDDWLPYREQICLSMGATDHPARQPHVYAEGGAVRLREGGLVLDLEPWVDRFDLLTA